MGLDKTISFKLSSSDTLFREIKTPNIVAHSYRIVTKADRIKLLYLISGLQTTMKSDSLFEIGPDEKLLILSNGNGREYYIQDNRTQCLEFTKVADEFKRFDSKVDFKNVDLKSTYWNIKGIIEPPPPPNFIDTSKLVMPITPAL